MKNSCYFHRFHPQTHQCTGCGRWERGFAPKTVTKNAKSRAECQVCERTQAIDKDGTLGHHGYRRPGWGAITGDCFGEAHKPFPAYDALEQWLKWLAAEKKNLEAHLLKLPTMTELMVRDYNTKDGLKKITKPEVVHKYSEWDTALANAIYHTEHDLKQCSQEVQRVTRRIEKAKSLQEVK